MTRLRIGIDAVPMGNGKGIARFLELLLQALSAHPDPRIELIAFVDASRSGSLPPLPRVTYVPERPGRQARWDLVGFDRALRRERCDVAFTYSDRARASLPTVLYLFEVPDHRRAHRPPGASLYQRASDALTALTFRLAIRRAVTIAVSSASTQRDLAEMYGLQEARTELVRPAAAGRFLPAEDEASNVATRKRFAADAGYFFHISSANDPRDNTATVLRAFAKASGKIGGHQLRIAGIGALDARDVALCPPAVLRDVRCLGRVSDDDLVQLYQAATAYVDPSLYEGFGFQVAEAMACGTPVIASNTTSLPELVGDGICLPPGDADAFAQSMIAIATDTEERNRLRAHSLRQARKLDWAQTAATLGAAFVRAGSRER